MTNNIKIGSSILDTITVALYENPIIFFREYVQNSLDAYNHATIEKKKTTIKKFYVKIDINYEEKKITINDNGYGIKGDNLFKNKMLSIGDSDKITDRTKYIGFRGIGRISGLPFCKKLIFRNKSQDSDKINECIWDGDLYRKLLNEDESIKELATIISEVVKIKYIKLKDYKERNVKKSEHFFEVIMDSYSPEISAMMEKKSKFQEKLIRMLPLKYCPKFQPAKKIMNKYKSFMQEDLSKFMISVKYNGKDLYKSYDQSFILGSEIIFWEIRGKQQKSGAIGEKIGLLWFTFDKHLKTHKNNDYYGILTRSKNVFMGNNDTFAQIANDSSVYITTFREMAQSLRGIFGELLVNSQNLRDNSRRDWFLYDEYSTHLNNVITEFMQRLHNYRYCASKYFRSNPSKTKEDLKQSLDELINLKDNKINYDYFYDKGEKKSKDSKKNGGGISLSEEDIPHKNLTTKKYYDLFMNIIKKFFEEEKQHQLFLKLRAYMLNHFKKM